MQTDEIIPFFAADASPFLQTLLLDFSYRFDDVLEPEKLRDSLTRLLEIGDWKKLGARVRQDRNGSLAYHVPQSYSVDRPAVTFSSETIEQNIGDHAIASRMPQASTTPSIKEDPYTFTALTRGPNHASTFDVFLNNDRPPLTLHVVVFKDATIMTLSFSHTLLDGVGRKLLFDSWLHVLNGEEAKVPPFMGYAQDPLDALDKQVPAEKHVLYEQLTKFPIPAPPAEPTAGEPIEATPYQEPELKTKVVYLPGDFVKSLKDQAISDIKPVIEKTESAFLSEGDVLFAWWARTTVAAMQVSPQQRITLSNVFNLRGAVEEALPSDKAFINNAASSSYTFLSASELLTKPLGLVALEIRRSLQQQRTAEQIKAGVSLARTQAAHGLPVMFGPLDAIMISWSNWHRARFFEMDFSAAVVHPGTPLEQRTNKLGTPSYVNVTGHQNGFKIRNGGPLIGRDQAGGWWISWPLEAQTWPIVEASLRGSWKEAA